MEPILLESVIKHMEEREEIRNNQHGFTKARSCLINQVAFKKERKEPLTPSLWTSVRL